MPYNPDKSIRSEFNNAAKPPEAERQHQAKPEVALGPKNQPGMHLRPEGPERRAVDAQIHAKQLADARAQAEKKQAETNVNSEKQKMAEQAQRLRDIFNQKAQQKDQKQDRSR